MSLSHLTELACDVNAIYAEHLGVEVGDLWLLAKLQEELGELASATLSATGRGRSRGADAAAYRAEMAKEAADLFGFLLVFAAREGIDLEAALKGKWGKYAPKKMQAES